MLTNVTELYLSNNNLNGPIPDFTGMNLLTYVDLSSNSFNSSAVPPWFTTLSLLTTLRMENSGLKGEIPPAFFSLPNLQTVVLRNNQLSGTLNISTGFSFTLKLIDLQNNSIAEYNSGGYNNSIVLDDNPFCAKPEAAGICKTVERSNFFNFTPEFHCAPLACFSSPVRGSDCKLPYLGKLVFRSFNFSDLSNESYYTFLNNSLRPLLESLGVPIGQICLVNSVIDMYGYLVLSIAFFPRDGAYFDRQAISTIGNVINNNIFPSPYGPFYFTDLAYFPGLGKKLSPIIWIICAFVPVLLIISAGIYAYRQRNITKRAAESINHFSSWNLGNVPQLKGARWLSFEDVKKCTNNFSVGSEIGVGGYGKVYKGKLDNGQLVAIKRAQQGSLQGAVEFKTEIELLSRVHHKNIVNLVGFCYDKGEQMLIYEYVPNGSLRKILSVGALKSLRRKWKNTSPSWVGNDPCGHKWEGISCNNSRDCQAQI